MVTEGVEAVELCALLEAGLAAGDLSFSPGNRIAITTGSKQAATNSQGQIGCFGPPEGGGCSFCIRVSLHS